MIPIMDCNINHNIPECIFLNELTWVLLYLYGSPVTGHTYAASSSTFLQLAIPGHGAATDSG